MKAKEFKKVILFMANRWSKETAIEIFGKNMGEHFWNKWFAAHGAGFDYAYRGPDYATMKLFYEMTETHLQMLFDYIEANYNG